MKWINVKDELPDYDKPIIALKKSDNSILNWLYGYGNKIFIGRLVSCEITRGNKKYTWEFNNLYCFTDVEYWMPFPEKPNK